MSLYCEFQDTMWFLQGEFLHSCEILLFSDNPDQPRFAHQLHNRRWLNQSVSGMTKISRRMTPKVSCRTWGSFSQRSGIIGNKTPSVPLSAGRFPCTVQVWGYVDETGLMKNHGNMRKSVGFKVHFLRKLTWNFLSNRNQYAKK